MATPISSEEMERFRNDNHSAFILGYTGEVGKELVRVLNHAKMFKRVVLIGRRQIELDVGSEFEQKVVDMDKIEDYKDAFAGLDYGFCCLGTTRAKAGKEGFIKVDKTYVLAGAMVAVDQGCKTFSVMSSTGSDEESNFLYTRIKGEVEHALREMKFDRLNIFQPGLIMVDREESRTGEKVMRTIMKPVAYLFPTAGTASATVIANALMNGCIKTQGTPPEVNIYTNKPIHELSGIKSGRHADK